MLACRNRETLLNELIESGASVDFTQGIDARFITDDIAKLINQVKIKTIHFAFDFMKNEKAIIRGLEFLLLKFWANDELVYMMPIGNGDLTKVLDALVEDAHREGEPFCLLGICSGMCSELEAFMPGKFQFTADRDYADYLYLRTDLATLAGKKFQSKRNHVNKFKRTYNYEYTPIKTYSQAAE